MMLYCIPRLLFLFYACMYICLYITLIMFLYMQYDKCKLALYIPQKIPQKYQKNE